MNKFIVFLILLPALSFGQTLSSVESVEFDPLFHRFLASNENNIIVVDHEGNELEYFGSAPEADFGMEIMDTVIYTIVGGSVKGFGLTSGNEVMNTAIAGAQFLNGMASDGDHRLWVTDFNAKKIHELDVTDWNNVAVDEVVSNTTSKPNGIVYDQSNNRLVFVNWGSNAAIKAVDLSNYALSTLVTTSLSNMDGIDLDDDGSYYVSTWTPTRITRFTDDFATDEIITAPGLSDPADICVATSIDTLIIPNSGNNTITFVGLNTSDISGTIDVENITLEIFPNPVNDSSQISFVLPMSQPVELEIYNEQGKLVHHLLDGFQPAGEHKILMTALNLAPGVYICSLRVGSDWITTSFSK